MGSCNFFFLPRLVSNFDPTNLSLSSSYNYRCEPPCPATVYISVKHWLSLCLPWIVFSRKLPTCVLLFFIDSTWNLFDNWPKFYPLHAVLGCFAFISSNFCSTRVFRVPVPAHYIFQAPSPLAHGWVWLVEGTGGILNGGKKEKAESLTPHSLTPYFLGEEMRFWFPGSNFHCVAPDSF
jgi:hypothetical protein